MRRFAKRLPRAPVASPVASASSTLPGLRAVAARADRGLVSAVARGLATASAPARAPIATNHGAAPSHGAPTIDAVASGRLLRPAPLSSQLDSDAFGATGLPLPADAGAEPLVAGALQSQSRHTLELDGAVHFGSSADGSALAAAAAASLSSSSSSSAAAGAGSGAASSSGSGGAGSFSTVGEPLTGRAAYLDLQATTPLDPRVLDAMLPYMVQRFGNPHSRTHSYGWDAEAAVEKARKQVADLIGADPKEIIFTSGATEANNMAVKGVARFYRDKKRHVITTTTEHKCVLDSCRALEADGWTVTYLPVGSNGLIDLGQLEAAITPSTSLVSIMGVNNEIGVIQPLAEIGALCRRRKVFFHTDAAQMVGKVPLNVDEANVDLMSLSGHKLYGPKGIGALYVRRRPRVRLEPLISGGGQERGLRSGTLPHPLVVGLGAACEVAGREMAADRAWVDALSARLQAGITSRISHVTLNGDPSARYPGNVNFSFAYVEGESLLMSLKNLAVSSGSACTSASLEPSYVLRAIGLSEDLAHTSIRFGLGRFTTRAEVDLAIEQCVRSVTKLRDMSPLWEMVQEGIDISKIQWSQDH